MATALQANTTLKVLNISDNRGIAVDGVESISKALSVNNSLEKLRFSKTCIGDEGIAHIVNALQTNTTMKILDIRNCGISCKGAKSIARVLSVNSSLEELFISFNNIGDDGIGYIANALQANTTMKVLNVFNYWYFRTSNWEAESQGRALASSNSLERLDISTSSTSIGDDRCIATDKAAMSLATALTTSTSMEIIKLSWRSSNPDTTLSKMVNCVRKSTLRELELDIHMPRLSDNSQVISVEKEWLQHVYRCRRKGVHSVTGR